MRANALANGRSRCKGTRRCRFCLAHAAKRQRAQRGERATGKARSPQEAAAVETIALARQACRN